MLVRFFFSCVRQTDTDERGVKGGRGLTSLVDLDDGCAWPEVEVVDDLLDFPRYGVVGTLRAVVSAPAHTTGRAGRMSWRRPTDGTRPAKRERETHL